MDKYFPRDPTRTAILGLKPYLFSTILDPRFKLSHFEIGGTLYFNRITKADIKDIFIEEFNR